MDACDQAPLCLNHGREHEVAERMPGQLSGLVAVLHGDGER